MKIINNINKMKAVSRGLKSQGKSIGFVPTMGCLHEGHLGLVRNSIQKTDSTIVSIFVNPAQFGPEEDFKKYPRNIVRDTRILKREKVSYLFLPSPEDIYPFNYKTYIEVTDLQEKLCGASRPGHFRGVCTVVLKLFSIIHPDLAFFGQKDAQQAIILKKMADDLHLDIKVKVLPIVRDNNGLALSSRNEYLSVEERKAALILYKSLQEAKIMIENGELESAVIIRRMKRMINNEPLAKIDYVELVSTDKLNPQKIIKGNVLLALAVFVGKTRLIDNMIIEERKEGMRFKE